MPDHVDPTLPDEPQWSDSPPRDSKPIRMDLRRVPGGGTGLVIVLSNKIEWVPTHYYKGRTIPHLNRGCVPCADNREIRWHGYFYVMGSKSFNIWILQVTPAIEENLKAGILRAGKLRGLGITIERKGRKANGELELSTRGMYQHPLPPDDLPELRSLLKRIWKGGFDHITKASSDELLTVEDLTEGVQ